ncbi:ABC transporter ATP-binding protein [Bradyrhizobium sp. Y36]|uniref:ABC transporter ATP-binding protein n=1 Tax=Bradyrhizobium sp. Y36 TaxID=2035447 RepID=UPI000BE9E2D5|nr:ABC transporter ATP-binding protein [Bradyrhizobium sp. Y36]PDT82266.1 ABC transporter ATP-binding protein [Bradyrhizobium sp. Y36]
MPIELQRVSLRVGETDHLRDVSLTLNEGAVNVLLGPTLAGKTSLMRLMAGLDQPTAGRIVINGEDVTGRSVRKRSVAMVYQQFINYPAFSVYDNIAAPLRTKGLNRHDVRRKVTEAAKLLKLDGVLEKTPLQLSGGQQQRTAIARAIVKDADLVLLDEPLANLDYKLREELRVELPKIFGKTGSIFVYATTEPSEALLLGGRTAAMHEGRIAQFDDTTEVYRRPLNRITAQTLSDPPMNFARMTVGGGSAGLHLAADDLAVTGFEAPPAIAALPTGSYTVGFRAHHVTLLPRTRSAVKVTGELAVAELSGSDSFLHVDTDGGERWIALLSGVHEHPPGERITIYLDPARFYVFDAGNNLVVAPSLAISSAGRN